MRKQTATINNTNATKQMAKNQIRMCCQLKQKVEVLEKQRIDVWIEEMVIIVKFDFRTINAFELF